MQHYSRVLTLQIKVLTYDLTNKLRKQLNLVTDALNAQNIMSSGDAAGKK